MPADDNLETIKDLVEQRMVNVLRNGRSVVAGDKKVNVDATPSDIKNAIDYLHKSDAIGGMKPLKSVENTALAEMRRELDKRRGTAKLPPIDVEGEDPASEAL